MPRPTHLITIVAFAAVAHICLAAPSDGNFESTISAQFTADSSVSITLDPNDYQGSFDQFLPVTAGDGVNLDPYSFQTSNTTADIRAITLANGGESKTSSYGYAAQSVGTFYSYDVTNTGTSTQNVTVAFEVDEHFTIGGQGGDLTGSGGYSYEGANGTLQTCFFQNYFDQTQSVYNRSIGFKGAQVGPGEFLGWSVLNLTVASGTTNVVSLFSQGSAEVYSTPEPPVVWLGLAGIGVLLLRRKSA